MPTPPMVDPIITSLRLTFGSDFVDQLLDVTPRPEQQVVIDLIENQDGQLDDLGEQLQSLTFPGLQLNPAHEGIDVVWVYYLRRLRGDPKRGSHLARRWFVNMERQMWEDAAVHAANMAVAAYSVAAFEVLRGRDYEVRVWSTMANTHVEHEEPAGLGPLTWLRFQLLWPSENQRITAPLSSRPVERAGIKHIYLARGFGSGKPPGVISIPVLAGYPPRKLWPGRNFDSRRRIKPRWLTSFSGSADDLPAGKGKHTCCRHRQPRRDFHIAYPEQYPSQGTESPPLFRQEARCRAIQLDGSNNTA